MKSRRKDKSKRKFRSLRVKALLVILFVSLILIILGSSVGLLLHVYSSLRNYKSEGDHMIDYMVSLEDTAYLEDLFAEGRKVFNTFTDADLVDPFTDEYMARYEHLITDKYRAAQSILTKCQGVVGNQNIWFFFPVVSGNEDMSVYMLDAEPSEQSYPPGTCLESPSRKEMDRVCDSKWRLKIVQFDKDGYVAADYKRLYSRSGKQLGYVELDMDLTDFAVQMNRFLQILIPAILLLVIFIAWLSSRILGRHVITHLTGLAAATKEYTARDNTAIEADTPSVFEPLDLHTSDEIEELWANMTHMENDVKESVIQIREMTAEQERINAELGIAAEIQLGMLPDSVPENDAFTLCGSMVPAKEVGGDLYDYFMIDDHHLAVVVADVSGTGRSAALFMMVAKTLINNQTGQDVQDPADICTIVNEKLIEVNKAHLFVTAWLGIVDLQTGEVRYVDAGHDYPAICHDGKFRVDKDKKCLPLAAAAGMKYASGSFTLMPGDALFLYTDGVCDATNSDNELMGRERMVDALNRDPEADPGTLIRHVTEAIADFVQDAPQFDDTTMLCLRYLGYHSDKED